MTVVPFCSRSPDSDQQAWIAALNAALIGSDIVVRRLDEMDAADRDAARVAIVANPDPNDLAALPRLEWVQSLWAGVERLVVDMAGQKVGIVRMEDPQLAETMAEAVLAWTLYLHRDMPRYLRQQRQREWRQQPLPLPQDRTIGILGFGNLGRAAAAKLVANGFTVRAWSRTGGDGGGILLASGADGLRQTLAAADIIVVLLPLTPETTGLLEAEALAKVKPGAALINFARGPIVEEAALLAALDDNQLSHAVLDVFDVEPLPESHPFWARDDITVLPHISAPTNKTTASRIAARHLRDFLSEGTIPPTLERHRGY